MGDEQGHLLAPLQDAAQDIVVTCRAELEQSPDPARAARLYYEMAQAYEGALGDLNEAARYYRMALDEAPDHVPSIQGARRVRIELGQLREALPLYDAELHVTPEPRRKALLHYQRGRLLADALGDADGARAAFRAALELDPANLSILKAAERCEHAAGEYAMLAQLLERAANAIVGDDRCRAALIAARARLVEHQLGDRATAAELYESALRLDPTALGALEALQRIHADGRDWTRLISALERDAASAQDAPRRAVTLYRSAQLHAQRLGNLAEAIAALADAAACAPGEPLLLEELARLYEQAGDYQALVPVYRDLIAATPAPRDRVGLLHTLGQAHERQLGDEAEAIRCYREALGLDPACVPVLQALGTLLSRREDWLGLVDMHLAEAEATDVTGRRAAAHARVAEIYEVKLQRVSDAAAHHARALALVPGYPASFKALVRLYAQAGEHRELIELYERAVDDARDVERRIAYLLKIGSIWEDALHDPVQAAHAYRRVLKLRHDHLGALHALQRVSERAGRHDELVDYLEREAELTDDLDVVVGLLHRAGSVMDEQLGDAVRARTLLLRVLELDPGFVPALASLGRIYYRDGRWSELLEMYERELDVTGAAGPRARLLTKMGELCESRLGRAEAAISYYRQAIDEDPGYQPAVRALHRLLRAAGAVDELATLLESQVSGFEDASSRAMSLYRAGEIHEEQLGDRARAEDLYRRALAEQPAFRAAGAALGRLLAAGGKWHELCEYLASEADATTDPRRAAAALLRCGQVFRDHLGDDERAITCFEAARAHDPLPALLELEPLHAARSDWAALAGCYAQQAAAVSDPGARLAALRQLARVQESRGVGEPDDRARTYEAILALDPDDALALAGLAEVARRRSDTELLTRIHTRLGDRTADAAVAAEHYLQLAQILEAAGATSAIDAYRAALARAPATLSAVRGLARLADAVGDDPTSAEAARREAELTLAPRAAADCLVRSATIRLQRLRDLEGAAEDLERALDTWPDHQRAAEMIREPLVALGRARGLVDILSRAASSAAEQTRAAALWLVVGDLYADELDNLGAALAAVKRALVADPDGVEVRRQLAALLVRNAQWPEALTVLDEMLARAGEPALRRDILVEQARLWGERLGDRQRALACIDAALAIEPDFGPALEQRARLALAVGDLDAGRQTALALVERAESDEQRLAALLLLADVAEKAGDDAAVEEALGQAVALEGADGEAARRLRARVADAGRWPVLASALAMHLQRGDGGSAVSTYLALAGVYADGMGLGGKAVETLEDGLRRTRDARLAGALLARARRDGRAPEAVRAIVGTLADAPREAPMWRCLAETYRDAGAARERRLALSALDALDAIEGGERDELRRAGARPAGLADGALDVAAIATIAVDRALQRPAAQLVPTMAEAIGKLVGADVRKLGLGRRERLAPRSAHPVRALIDRIGAIVGIECEVYEHSRRLPLVEVVMTEPVSLVVSVELGDRAEAQQAFLIARLLAAVSCGLHPVLSLGVERLEDHLAAAAQLAGVDTDPRHAELAQRLRKALPRKHRKAFELAAADHAAAPPLDVGAWRAHVARTMNRAAALAADDLAEAIDALRFTDETGDRRGDADDLLAFWLSDAAMAVRGAG